MFRATVNRWRWTIGTFIGRGPCRTAGETADELSCSHTIVKNRLHALSKVRKQSASGYLTWINRTVNRLHFASFSPSDDFLTWLVIRDEKWMLYANIVRRHAWVKRELIPIFINWCSPVDGTHMASSCSSCHHTVPPLPPLCVANNLSDSKPNFSESALYAEQSDFFHDNARSTHTGN